MCSSFVFSSFICFTKENHLRPNFAQTVEILCKFERDAHLLGKNFSLHIIYLQKHSHSRQIILINVYESFNTITINYLNFKLQLLKNKFSMVQKQWHAFVFIKLSIIWNLKAHLLQHLALNRSGHQIIWYFI